RPQPDHQPPRGAATSAAGDRGYGPAPAPGGPPRALRGGFGPLRGRVPATDDRVGGRAHPRRILRAGLAGILAGRGGGATREGSGRGPGGHPRYGLSVQEPGRRPAPARDRAIRVGVGGGALGERSWWRDHSETIAANPD